MKIKNIKKMHLEKNIYNRNVKKYKECPYCGSKSFIKYGKYIMEFSVINVKMKSAKKHFQIQQILYGSTKHKPEKWFEFIELMGEHTTLNECSYKLGRSIVTAFYWRHKNISYIENNYKTRKI
ncbi:transposase [Clostridium butyricum]